MTDETKTSTRSKKSIRLSPKQIIAAIVLVLVIIFAVQNTASTEIRFFGADLDSPLWVWFLGLLAVGVAIGFLLPYGRKKK